MNKILKFTAHRSARWDLRISTQPKVGNYAVTTEKSWKDRKWGAAWTLQE